MPSSPALFFSWLLSEAPLAVTVFLTLAMALVNGWTDAPNAIAGAVSAGALPFSAAALLAAGCNFAGAMWAGACQAGVVQTMISLAGFGSDPAAAPAALCAAMSAVVVWACAAWYFGIPTSESHALMAGLAGASLALGGVPDPRPWGAVALGLVLSSAAGALLGLAAGRLTARLSWRERTCRRALVPGAALAAFLHGAQDSQKFLGVFVLGAALAQGLEAEELLPLPLWPAALCALAMALGTALGGRRIIRKVAQEMVELTPRRALAADLAGGACLLSATVWGIPVSTTHTRAAALVGAAAGSGGRWDGEVVRQLWTAWILTFPLCAALGFAAARLLLLLF